jgi:hypothetical protein
MFAACYSLDVGCFLNLSSLSTATGRSAGLLRYVQLLQHRIFVASGFAMCDVKIIGRGLSAEVLGALCRCRA